MIMDLRETTKSYKRTALCSNELRKRASTVLWNFFLKEMWSLYRSQLVPCDSIVSPLLQGTFPDPLMPAANSIVCTKNTALLRDIFNQTYAPERPINFPPRRCRNALTRCKGCLNQLRCAMIGKPWYVLNLGLVLSQSKTRSEWNWESFFGDSSWAKKKGKQMSDPNQRPQCSNHQEAQEPGPGSFCAWEERYRDRERQREMERDQERQTEIQVSVAYRANFSLLPCVLSMSCCVFHTKGSAKMCKCFYCRHFWSTVLPNRLLHAERLQTFHEFSLHRHTSRMRHGWCLQVSVSLSNKASVEMGGYNCHGHRRPDSWRVFCLCETLIAASALCLLDENLKMASCMIAGTPSSLCFRTWKKSFSVTSSTRNQLLSTPCSFTSRYGLIIFLERLCFLHFLALFVTALKNSGQCSSLRQIKQPPQVPLFLLFTVY